MRSIPLEIARIHCLARFGAFAFRRCQFAKSCRVARAVRVEAPGVIRSSLRNIQSFALLGTIRDVVFWQLGTRLANAVNLACFRSIA